ncbi:MAG: glycoside hydrolase family 31 protein [Candidatus Binatia bacterium]
MNFRVALCALAALAGVVPGRAGAADEERIESVLTCLFDAATERCETQDWNDDVVVTAADVSGLLRFTPPGPYQVRVVDSAGTVIMRSAATKVRIDKSSAGLILDSTAGARLAASAAPPALTFGTRAQPLHGLRNVRRVDRGVELTGDAGTATVRWTIEFLTARAVISRLRPAEPVEVTRVRTTLRAAPDEHFYGLTERIADARIPSEITPQEVGSLDRRGEIVTMVVTPTVSLYTPFFHSSHGYGVYVAGTMPGTYDVAATDPNTVAMDFEFNQRTGEHRVFYFVGDHDAILDEYTAVTGRPFLPPRWSFRHLRWRDEHRIGPPAPLNGVEMNADLVDDVTMYERLGIPAGNYAFDRPWTSGSTDFRLGGFTSFQFDPVRFPNRAAMLAALQRRGYHVFVWAAPWALGDNAPDAQWFDFLAPRSTLLIDFTNPDAVAWWTARVQSLVDLGISGLKLDRSEFDRTELPVVPDQVSDVFADGRSGRELKNGYTVVYARVHHDALADRLGSNFFNYLRAGYAGSQQYGAFWGGDTTARNTFGIGKPTDLGLRSAILSLLHVAFMAFPIWGTDTGGFYQFGDRDVFARWIEFSALCPFMEIGGGNQGGGQHAPWDMPTEPHFDVEMIDIYRRYVTLHHELIPLLYSLAIEAHASGRPLARPLIFDFPNDPAVADLGDEYLLGHDLLVAPLWRVGDRSRTVYLPRGTWIDYWQPTNRLTGPTTVAAAAPLDRLPLYVRAGGILPLDVDSAVTGNGSPGSAGRLTIDGYPSDDPSSFTLREDGGETTFALSDTRCGGSPCVTLQISPSRRGFVVRLLVDSARGVSLDGNPLPAVTSFAAFSLADRGWFYDAAAARLWITFSTSGGAVQLTAIR